MKTLLRYFVIGVVAAVLFLVAGVAIFAAVFDANAYKDDLSGLVREQTGRDLQFHGDVSLTVFPALGMKLGAMSFSNPAEFGAQPMIKVSEASISVDVASLITLAPEIEQLVLRDLEINLITNKAGKTNWEDLLQRLPLKRPNPPRRRNRPPISNSRALSAGSICKTSNYCGSMSRQARNTASPIWI